MDSSQMRPDFVLIDKCHSDGVSIARAGPSLVRHFLSECSVSGCGGRSYRTGAELVARLVPSRFVTTLTVGGEGEELLHHECVALVRRTVAREFSETTSVFVEAPCTVGRRRFKSSLHFRPDAAELRYRVGLELVPARRAYYYRSEEEHPLNGDIE